MEEQDEGQLLKKARQKRRKSFWLQIKRDHEAKFMKKISRSRSASKSCKPGAQCWTLDRLAAQQKLERLKLLTTTDLSIANSAEPYRVSSFILFKRNLLDPTLCVSTCTVYLLCRCMLRETCSLSFVLMFLCLAFVINHHIDSYRSFVAVNESTEILSKDYTLRRTFLSTHLGYNPKRRVHVQPKETGGEAPGDRPGKTVTISEDRPELIEEKPIDSFHWMNKIITFFWPYLSHLIHFELNEFFRDQIESGTLGRSNDSIQRLYYAILRQLNANVLAIERCQLGHQAPFIKNLACFEGNAITESRLENKKNATKVVVGAKEASRKASSPGTIDPLNQVSNQGKTLVFNIELEYNGDMDISVIYRYLCCCSSKMGLKDVFLHFNLQIVFGPIKADIPFTDQISFTLLEKPEFGYRGIALVELGEVRIVRRVVNALISDYLLHPRMVTVRLSDLLDTLINGPPSREQRRRLQDAKRVARKRSLLTKSGKQEVSLFASFTAKAILLGCFCSNVCLRACQRNRADEHDDEDESEIEDDRRSSARDSRTRSRTRSVRGRLLSGGRRTS